MEFCCHLHTGPFIINCILAPCHLGVRAVRVEFEYLNLEWQEALFTEVFDDPRNRMSFVVSNKQLPCNEEYIFVAKAYGVNGE